MQALRQKPGMNKSQLGRTVGLSWATTSYHLRVLQKRGAVLISYGRRRGLQCYPIGIPPSYRNWMATLQDPSSLRVLQAIGRDGALHLFELRARVPLSERALRRKLRRLEGDSLVVRQGLYRPRFNLNPELQGWIPDESGAQPEKWPIGQELR
jgi:DNA-binding transcriptional ArsR family regulator